MADDPLRRFPDLYPVSRNGRVNRQEYEALLRFIEANAGRWYVWPAQVAEALYAEKLREVEARRPEADRP